MNTKRPGFTLIELLVVILIIGLLAAISGGGYMAARKMFAGLTARQEMDNIIRAVEEYKSVHGEYPPDEFATDQEIKRHILKRWPNLLKTNKSSKVLDKHIDYYKNNIAEQGQLLFWLCGPPTYDGTGRRGFSTNKENPFGLDFNPSQNEYISQLVDELGQNIGQDGKDHSKMTFDAMYLELAYDLTDDNKHSGNCNGSNLVYKDKPLVYFKAGREQYQASGNNINHYGAYANPNNTKEVKWHEFPAASGLGVAVPYAKSMVGAWQGQDSYQLISPGEDGCYGPDPSEPGYDDKLADRKTKACVPESGDNMTPQDSDNITNFSAGATLAADQK